MDKEELIRDIARSKELPAKEIKLVVDSEFALVAKAMRRGKGESVRLPYWGVFEIDDYRMKKLLENTGGKGLRQLEE